MSNNVLKQLKALRAQVRKYKDTLDYYEKLFREDGIIDNKEQAQLDQLNASIERIRNNISERETKLNFGNKVVNRFSAVTEGVGDFINQKDDIVNHSLVDQDAVNSTVTPPSEDTSGEATSSNPTVDTAPYSGSETWDPITNTRIKTLDARVQSSAFQFVNKVQADLNMTIRVSSAFRSIAEQDALFAKGNVTQARGGQSYHNYGLAIDVVEITNSGQANWNADWAKIASIGKGLGFEWGGDWTSFVDKPHFQMPFGKSVSELCLQHYPDRARELY